MMVPNGWNTLKLGELGGKGKPAVKAGPFGSALKKEFYTKTGYKIYGQEQVISNDPFHGDYFISQEKYDSLKSCSVTPGDILISLVGTVGKVLLLPDNAQPGIINPRLLRLSLNTELMCGSFTKYFLESENTKNILNSWAQGGTMGVLNAEMLKALKVPVPPLPEQRKIAKILSTWDKAISTTERLIDNSKQQKKALMQQLLTGKKRLFDDSGKPFEGEWEDVLLGNIVDRPICYGVLKPGDHTEGGIPLLRIQDLKGSLLNESQMIRITEELHQEFKRTILREGDLVMSIVGTLGKVLKIPSQLEGANITRAFAVIGIAEHSTDFIKQYLTSGYIQEWLLNTATGNAQKVLNVAAIKKLKINVPAIEEQRKIAIVLGYADKEIELFEQQLADLKQEKKALMQQLLTGKRRVKLDDKEVA